MPSFLLFALSLISSPVVTQSTNQCTILRGDTYFVEACEVTPRDAPRGHHEFDVMWCIQTDNFAGCQKSERPWGCSYWEGDNIATCILTILDEGCDGCLSGCSGNECDE